MNISQANRQQALQDDPNGAASRAHSEGARDAAASAGLTTVFKQSVLNVVHAHGAETTDVEICGILVGNISHDEGRVRLHVVGAIRGEHAASYAGQVTFTGETWNHIHAALDHQWSGSQIVGWYHTHPGFGIFLSHMDLFIHENFFGAPEQVALVYDPLGGDEGLFVWQADALVRTAFQIEPDAEPLARTATPQVGGLAVPPSKSDVQTPPSDPQQVNPTERRRAVWLACLCLGSLLAGLAVAWCFASGSWPFRSTPLIPHDSVEALEHPGIEMPHHGPIEGRDNVPPSSLPVDKGESTSQKRRPDETKPAGISSETSVDDADASGQVNAIERQPER
ncbi:MAG: Mov34/MPN/PAD-1 family protein [Pirellulales bacterium]